MGRPPFGQSIKRARIKLGMTQTELGEKLSPPRGQGLVWQWESGNAIPSDEYKVQLRRLLGQTPNVTAERKDAAVEEAEDEDEDEEAYTGPSAIGTWLNRHRLERHFSVPELAAKAGLSAVAIYNIESGRSQNPQRETIAKLEVALNQRLSPEAKAEAKDEATIEGVGEWFNFDPNNQADWPSTPGIYALYDISDRPIYVGQGDNIATRLRDHHQKFWFRQPIV
jgi:transcriptional regulator with XRE-family HTH domain